MAYRKSIIPFIIICALVFSLMGGVVPAFATDLPDTTLCEDCYICDNCKICKECYTCDNCKTCEKCYTCDDCKNCKECYTCDKCKTCEKCYTCESCKNCEECHICDDCKTCEECYICEDCKNCEECYICDDCKTCEECYTCDDCKNCEECYTCDDCRTDDGLSSDSDLEDSSPDAGNGDESSDRNPEDGFSDVGIDMASQSPEMLAMPPVYDAIEQFVIRLYKEVHGRAHDEGGFQFWSNQLRSGNATGASVARGFFFSPEFNNRPNINNDVYLNILYRTLMNRNPDAGGFSYWSGRLYAGLPREDVFAGFVNSPEFTRLCESYGITRGNYTPPRGGMARVFATRLYLTTLQREPDLGGLNFWHNALASGSRTGASVAYHFIFSPEMENRGLKDDAFIEILYNALMGRKSDAGGKAFWVDRLSNGNSRYSAFYGFVNSSEFDRICKEHGIIKGTLLPPAPPARSGPLSGKVIILDAGHGTSGSPGAAGYNEAVAMLDLARRLRPLLEEQGATVILTRDSETNIPISVRCAMINIEALRAVRATRSAPSDLAEIDWLIGVMQTILANPGANGPRLMNVDPFNAARQIHPDLRRIFEITNNSVIRDNFLVISLHSNATGNGSTSANGAEVYFIDPGSFANTRTYYPGFSYTGQSRSFGNILLNHIHSTGIVRRSNGLRAENFAMIREINVPAVLAENGFHTNASDRALLSDPAYRQVLATAYYNAITEYFR